MSFSTGFPERPPLIPAPNDPKEWDAWRESLENWRTEARQELNYTGANYDKPEFAWMQRCFAFAKVMLFDREFLNPETGEFQDQKWLDRMETEFGGIDALALWQAYPRIGIDTRNQFDHYRMVPGGLPALKALVERIQARGIRVVLAYNPWDSGTRRETKSDVGALADLVAAAGFDGIFLDTLPDGGREMRPAMDRVRPGVVLESELALPIQAIPDHHASWAQWFNDSEAPGVLRNKWFERRHMLHMIRRWDLDHSGELHMAWMNGAGVFLWQNIFGSWNGWMDRDKSILRSMLPIQRRFARHFTDGQWKPLVDTSSDHIYASRWTLDGIKLWTIVNRDKGNAEAYLMGVSSDPSVRLFDLVRGVEVDHGHVTIPGRWIGCIVGMPTRLINDDFRKFLTDQAARFAKARNGMERAEPMPVRVTPEPSVSRRPLVGMKEVIPGTYEIQSRMRVRECGEYGYGQFLGGGSVGLHQIRQVRRTIKVRRSYVMEREVTNKEFHGFLRASNYKPLSSENFLAHWVKGAPKSGDENIPVTHVSLEDARAYAKWAKLRLPTEDEWYLAVEAHRFPTGYIWNWTESEHHDGHTSFSILKGGWEKSVKGSDWYFDTGLQSSDFSAKYLHFWPGMDRSESISFRCAVDA